jgi:hypothetical protein
MGSKPTRLADAWTLTARYVAGMVRQGSVDAAEVLGYMHELRPGTAVTTGTLDTLNPDKVPRR